MAGTAAFAGRATVWWNRLFRTPASAVAPGAPATPGDARRSRSHRGRSLAEPASGAAPVVLHGPVAVPARPGRLVGPAGRLPDTFILLDEAAMSAIQHGGEVSVRGPGGALTRRSARRWWRELLRWLVARADLSVALSGLDPLGPGVRAGAAVEPATGLVSRSGTRVRVVGLPLTELVTGPGQVSRRAASAAALRVLGAVVTDPGAARCRQRVVLRALHPALCRLGVEPGAYRGLRLTERLLATACRAVEDAAEASARPGGEPEEAGSWPLPARDMARLRRGRLTVISPFEFLPADGADARAWLDLLPAIRVVDAVGWRRPRGLRGCGPDELAVLYRLTWAVRRARGSL